jgi:N-acetylmuramic acid 6-phosphate (MurNAc-6-P) etherase
MGQQTEINVHRPTAGRLSHTDANELHPDFSLRAAHVIVVVVIIAAVAALAAFFEGDVHRQSEREVNRVPRLVSLPALGALPDEPQCSAAG